MHPHMAPFYVREASFPPVDDAPVLALVKQTALDDDCGSALLRGVENGSKLAPRTSASSRHQVPDSVSPRATCSTSPTAGLTLPPAPPAPSRVRSIVRASR